MNTQTFVVSNPQHPDHVPNELYRELDIYNDPRMAVDPIGTIVALNDDRPIVWNGADPRFGTGSWVVNRAEDLRMILNDPRFAVGWEGHQKLIGEDWEIIPIGINGDYHRKFRTLMNPWFAPPMMNQMREKVARRAVTLIETFQDQKGCEFISSFARPFPVSIFMELMGLPDEKEEEFVSLENDLLHQTDLEVRAVAAKKVIAELRAIAAERRRDPRDDMTTKIVNAEFDGQPLTDNEVIGTMFALFLAGLDSIAAATGIQIAHLARDHQLQARLRAEPALIPRAIEEMMRRYSPANTRRQALEDIELHGVNIRAGDWIQVSFLLGSLDPIEFANPLEVNVERKSIRHFGFGYGYHFCLGSHLARLEMQIAFAELLKRLPEFSIEDESKVTIHGGLVIGIDNLPLVWG
ncbi:cytochrome P450 [Sphingopyxis granuli]|uniref:cytochrome P450 n=1 Tax=Sphingopyxis granuli TaxID=267128 RepID=UPI001F532FBD|nr:cytochrome P450 [Sphingopyxis granuli]UNK81064.1 cytochrome P450 [Sphingopyxis granuli]